MRRCGRPQRAAFHGVPMPTPLPVDAPALEASPAAPEETPASDAEPTDDNAGQHTKYNGRGDSLNVGFQQFLMVCTILA